MARTTWSPVLLLCFLACSRGGAVDHEGAAELGMSPEDGGGEDLAGLDLSGTVADLGGTGKDLRPSADLAAPDLWSGVLDVRIYVSGGCTVTTDPRSYGVPKGSTFTVNWINASSFPVDVAKIDMFNQVPIVIGLEPGNSYHDKVRAWCGMFTGTFNFRAQIGPGCSYLMPIRCDL